MVFGYTVVSSVVYTVYHQLRVYVCIKIFQLFQRSLFSTQKMQDNVNKEENCV